MTHPDTTVSRALAEAGAPQAVAVTLEDRTGGVPQLARLSGIGRRVVAREMADRLGELLDVDLLDLAERAWTTHDRLVAAGYRTAASAGREVVELGEHTVTSVHRPTVDLVVNDVVAATVHFELTLELDVASLVAAVRAGALVAVHPGRCTLRAALSCEGVPLPSATADVALPGSVDLGRGLRLVPESFLPGVPGPRTPPSVGAP